MPVRDLLNAASGASSAGPADPYFYDVSLLLNGDGTNGAQNNTFLDSSTNNFTITRNGNTTQGSFSPYGSLWSNFFNGSSSYLSLTNTTGLGSNNFTIEFWGRDITGSGNWGIFSIGAAGGSDFAGMTMASNGGLYISTSTGSWTYSNIGGLTVGVDGQWHHYAIVRNGGSLLTFKDGALIATTSISGSIVNRDGLYEIGKKSDGSSMSGSFSNFRVVNGTAVYTSAFTPSTTPLIAISGTSLLTCQSNRFKDNSSNNFTLTASGTPSVQRFSPFNPTAPYDTATIGGSGYFDGSGDYLTTPQNSAFNLGTGAFTVECWAYVIGSAGGSGGYGLLNLGNGAVGGGSPVYTGWGLIIDILDFKPFFYRYDGSEYKYYSSEAVKPNTWNHIAVSRDGSSNLAVFLNGVRVNSSSSSVSFNNVNSDPLNIGYRYDGGGGAHYFPGYISNSRIVNGTAIYDPTQTTITVPTAPLSSSGSTLTLSYQNAGIPDLAMQNNLETVGNAQVSTSVKKYGTGSLAFDGTGDYLQLPASQTVNFGLGNFTIEFWAYWAGGAFSGYNAAFDSRSGNSPFTDGVQIATNIINGYWYLSFATQELLTSVAATAAWQHIALVRNNGVYTLYINGTSAVTYTASNNMTNTTALIGTYYNKNGQYWNGYIDDLRITKGLARYTANFTPPASALPTF